MSESLSPIRIVCADGLGSSTRIVDIVTGEDHPIQHITRSITVHILPARKTDAATDLVTAELHLHGVPIDVAAHLSDRTLADLAREIADTRDMERSDAALAMLRMLAPTRPAEVKG